MEFEQILSTAACLRAWSLNSLNTHPPFLLEPRSRLGRSAPRAKHEITGPQEFMACRR